MQTRPRRSLTLLAAALAAAALAACDGSEGLEDLHSQALDDAANERSAGIATSAGDGSAPGTATDGDEPAVGAANPGADAGSAIDPDDYALVFQDEFRGSTLDESLWNTALPWGPDVVINDEEQYYVDALADARFIDASPFSFDGESLTIEASATPESLRAEANEQAWLSGVLTTAGKFEFTHGYAEARVLLPEGQALWPSFWMLGSGPDGLLPQLFVMERNGARPTSVFHNYEYVDERDELRSPGQFETVETADEDFSAGFHTVGVSWSPEELLFFVDGVPRYRIVGDDVPDEDMYLVLNLAIGGTWPGPSDASTPSPAAWTIDYVRVWQKRDGD